MSVGENIYDHYEKYFNEPGDRKVFEPLEGIGSIQILVYDRVVKGCKVYASLGLSRYRNEVGSLSEVVLVVDDGFDLVPAIFAHALFYVVENRMKMADGLSVKGIKNIDKYFYGQYQKNALYFTEPYCFPSIFSNVKSSSFGGVDIYLAIFLSDDEAGYLKEFGSEKFEELLESAGVDVFDVKRRSVV